MPILPSSRRGPVVDPGALLDATAVEYVASCIASGALVSLYRTRDGGAFGVTVTLDGETEKEYFRDPVELADWLRQVDEAIQAIPPAPSSAKRARKGS